MDHDSPHAQDAPDLSAFDEIVDEKQEFIEEAKIAAMAEAKRILETALSHQPNIVDRLLVACSDDTPLTMIGYERIRDEIAQKAGISVRALNALRKHAVKAATTVFQTHMTAAKQAEAAGDRVVVKTTARFADACDETQKVLEQVKPCYRAEGGFLATAMHRDETRTEEMHLPAGTFIERLDLEGMRYILSRYVAYERDTRDGPVLGDPPNDIAGRILSQGRHIDLPGLTGVAEFPVMRRDGTIALRAGYDSLSSYWIAGDWLDLPIPTIPTENDVAMAAAKLLDLVTDFGLSPEGQAAWLSHVLTLIARHLLPVSPAFFYAAPTAGSGKTLLATLANLIALGRNPNTLAAGKGGTDDDVEMRKFLTSMFVAGRMDILLDNVKNGASFGTPSLDALLTSPVWTDRILGASDTRSWANRTTVAITGNNPVIGADLARRVVLIYLTPDSEHPENRTDFRIPNLRQHVSQNRRELLAAALTILVGHFAAHGPLDANYTGPSGRQEAGSFEVWSRLVGDAVAWATGVHPLASQKDAQEASTNDDELAILSSLLKALENGQAAGIITHISAKTLTAIDPLEVKLASFGKSNINARERLIEALDDFMGTENWRKMFAPTKALGKRLSRNLNRVASGRRLIRLPRTRDNNREPTYRVEQV